MTPAQQQLLLKFANVMLTHYEYFELRPDEQCPLCFWVPRHWQPVHDCILVDVAKLVEDIEG